MNKNPKYQKDLEIILMMFEGKTETGQIGLKKAVQEYDWKSADYLKIFSLETYAKSKLVREEAKKYKPSLDYDDA